MKLFKLSEVYSAVCTSKATSSGFKHEAVLIRNGDEIGRAKCLYYNRTWECYEYESVLLELVFKFFKGDELQNFQNIIKAGC